MHTWLQKLDISFIDSRAYYNELYIHSRLGLHSKIKRNKSSFSSYVPNFYEIVDTSPINNSYNDDYNIGDIKYFNKLKRHNIPFTNNK